MKKREFGACAGFTLIEMLLVVAILAVLATIVAVRTIGVTGGAKKQATITGIEVIKTAIARFEMDIGRLPKNLEELVIEGDENWPGPFLDSTEVPRDGWNNEFTYEIKGKRVVITSPGPDGQIGTGDDIAK